ncbi:hypothetical protein JVT61DRAFT_7772 [Boletus reticuloceps]|uniref:Ribosome biogenesis protein NSA2 homolog n=1 Tax=Boletus reticuloceps TaxID=495285 RepID=A0A8I2YIH6_9AGAM|nr:hypothetical protein JVT61DRAFT_7772 [Boletus reticuloceps]
MRSVTRKRSSSRKHSKHTTSATSSRQTLPPVPDGALPTYLLDREGQKDAKALSSAIKQKRKDKAAKYSVPLPKVRGIAEDEMFKVVKTGKNKSKSWKRIVTKATFVGEGFTRKPVKMERFIRPMALRYKKANVTHPDLKATFQLQILSVKKNPQSPMYTQLGVLTKGTVVEVNVSELGMVTTGGKVVFGKYAQITNNPENDGCVNAVLPTNSPVPNSHSASPAPQTFRHAVTPLERQRLQLDRLLKDPSKVAFVPPPPKGKTIRPAREMMKNVQGSSAGAGSGEFHVYKAGRRREYERLKLMEEQTKTEAETEGFERRRKEAQDLAEAKTAKNRAKRQKKKERAKTKSSDKVGPGEGQSGTSHVPLKKRRLINGKELVFRKPGEETDEDVDEDEDDSTPEASAREELAPADSDEPVPQPDEALRIATERKIIIHEDD